MEDYSLKSAKEFMRNWDISKENVEDLKREVRDYIIDKLEQGMFRRDVATYQGDVVSIGIDSCKNLCEKDLLTCKVCNEEKKCYELINQKLKKKHSHWENDDVLARKICSSYEHNYNHSAKDYNSLLSRIIKNYVDPAHALARANLDSVVEINRVLSSK